MATAIDACVTLGSERETILSIADLLAQLDRAHVDQAVMHPDDRSLAVDHRRGNQVLLEAARQHPDRLIASCTANPWFGTPAIDAIREALASGARLVVFAPALQGFILGDEILFPVLDALAGQRTPVYVHTGPHLHSTPWQLAGVAERYPSIPFIMGHCGATDFWNDVPTATTAAANIYLESSFARPFGFKSHLDQVGAHRGVMGSGAPRNDLLFEWTQMREIFSPTENSGIYGETMRGLLNGCGHDC